MRREQVMLAVGLTMVVLAAIFLIGELSDSSSAIVFGAVGLVFIGVSRAKHRL